MSTLVFHSIEELQRYLNNAPDDDSFRITVTLVEDNGESCNEQEQNSDNGKQ